jgi:hypothetical protein
MVKADVKSQRRQIFGDGRSSHQSTTWNHTSTVWWRCEELNVNTIQKNKMVNGDIIKNRHCNVKTETTFLDFSSSQPQLNGEVGNGQDQYLPPYVLCSKFMWDWQSKSHLHNDLFVLVEGLQSWFESFSGRPLLLSLSCCLTHLNDQGSGSLLSIVCDLCVCILFPSWRAFIGSSSEL